MKIKEKKHELKKQSQMLNEMNALHKLTLQNVYWHVDFFFTVSHLV